MEKEQIILVDDNATPIGTAPKLASHHVDTPLHLAFSCYVFNNKGEFFSDTTCSEQKSLAKRVDQ